MTTQIGDNWYSGAGACTTWEQIISDVKQSVLAGWRVYVGADSMRDQRDCTFVVTVCIHNPGAGGRYYFRRFKCPTRIFPTLRTRIFREAAEAIDVTLTLLSDVPGAPIEIHLDVNRDKRYETGTFSEQVVGYARSIGVECKIKPDSWASSGIADKHTR